MSRPEAGFGGHELPIAVAIFGLLVGLGTALSWLLDLRGGLAALPAALLLGGFILLVVVLNVVDRRRHTRSVRALDEKSGRQDGGA